MNSLFPHITMVDRRTDDFPLAQMSPLIRVLTFALWLLPFSLLACTILSGLGLAGATALFLVILYGFVWLFCRPSRFELPDRSLHIVFPAWTRRVPGADITGARLLAADAFKQEYGKAMRIGVGGLWGGFGWLWTSRGGLVEFYVSRLDGLVLISKKNGKNILITPARPKEFVQVAQGLFNGRSMTTPQR